MLRGILNQGKSCSITTGKLTGEEGQGPGSSRGRPGGLEVGGRQRASCI